MENWKFEPVMQWSSPFLFIPWLLCIRLYRLAKSPR